VPIVPTPPQGTPPSPGKTPAGLLQSLHERVLTSKSRTAVVRRARFLAGGVLAIVGEDDDPEDPVPALRTWRSFDFSRLRMH
jgi:hypothetical protein